VQTARAEFAALCQSRQRFIRCTIPLHQCQKEAPAASWGFVHSGGDGEGGRRPFGAPAFSQGMWSAIDPGPRRWSVRSSAAVVASGAAPHAAQLAITGLHHDRSASLISGRRRIGAFVVAVTRASIAIRRRISVVTRASIAIRRSISVVVVAITVAGADTNTDAARPCTEVQALSQDGCGECDSYCSNQSNS
jgi:hypothetical protein